MTFYSSVGIHVATHNVTAPDKSIKYLIAVVIIITKEKVHLL